MLHDPEITAPALDIPSPLFGKLFGESLSAGRLRIGEDLAGFFDALGGHANFKGKIRQRVGPDDHGVDSGSVEERVNFFGLHFAAGAVTRENGSQVQGFISIRF